MYLLQHKLTKYFREININQEVILVDNVCKSMLFKTENEAIKFKNELMNNYNIKVVIIEI